MKELQDKLYYDTIVKRYLVKELSLPADFNITNYISLVMTNYQWSIPTQYLIPKDNGKFREIYSFNEQDSFFLKVINEILFAKCGHLINKNVYSYTKGVRTYTACKHIQNKIRTSNKLVGFKLDLSNYFLSVDKSIILNAVNELVEDDFGRNLLNRFFSINSYIHKGEVYHKELSLMPGSAISSFLANYIPHDIDDYISSSTDLYARYGDDMVIFTEDMTKLTDIYSDISQMYRKLGLTFNESKTEILNSREPITFLGLTTTRNEIDISTKNFMKMKKFIKHMTKIKIKKGDMHSVKACINTVNKLLLGQDESSIDLIPHTKLAYIYSNVTTDKTLKQLDFYFKDRIRQAYTGKNNTGNIRKLPNDKLVELGYTSFAQMYYISRVGKQFLYNEVSIRNFNNNNNTTYNPILTIANLIYSDKNENIDTDLEDFLMKLAKNSYPLLINSEIVYVEYLDFNLDNKCIKWKDICIAQSNKVITDLEYINTNTNTIIKVISNDALVHSKVDNHTELHLITSFIKSCYTDIYPMPDRRLYKNYKVPTQTRMYKLLDLIQIIKEDSLQFDIPSYVRKFKFNMYIYGHIVSNDLWTGINYSVGNLIEVPYQFFSLILKKSWFLPQ